MSLLDVGARCYTCNLVDFLPLACPNCTHIFCNAHVQTHDCDSAQPSAGPSRKRIKGTCAFAACEEETLESIGGFEGEEGIARHVRCICGEAYCISHRSQEAHGCTAPRQLSARHDAVLERREKAQEILRQNMPSQAGKERLTMPKQVDRTRREPPSTPSVGSTSEAIAILNARNVDKARDATPPADLPPPPAPSTSADEKAHKLHLMKLRPLAKPLDPKVARAECCAVEFGVSDAGRIAAWSEETKYSPSSAAAALSDRKPERLWIPLAMPGGKLRDTLITRSKHPRKDLSLVRVQLQPGAPREAVPIKLADPVRDQIAAGDVILLVG